MELSLSVKEEALTLTDAAGVAHEYTMREMTGAERDAYFDKQSKSMDKAGHVLQFKDLHCILISIACINKETGKPVTVEECRTWPASTQSAVFKRLQQLSGLGVDKDEDDPKNE